MQLITVDFDGTLFKGDSFKLMFQARKEEFGIREWAIIIAGSVKSIAKGIFQGKEALKKHFFLTFAKTFKGKSKEEITAFFNKLVHTGKSKIDEELVQMMRTEKENGNEVILLSGALTPYLEAAMREVQLDVPIIGTNLIFNKKEKCTGQTSGYISGNEKVNAVKTLLMKKEMDRSNTTVWAYADSESDLPLLHFADKPVVVNGNKKMNETAKINHWIIYPN